MKTDELDTETVRFENIEYLVINRMDYNWNDVLKVVKHFPNIKELKVCFNCITIIGDLTPELKNNLKTLDLEANPIEQASNFKDIGQLKK